jgi:hypothetical protein
VLRRRVATLALALLCGSWLVARADDATDRARAYFDAGKQAAQKGQFTVAITAFEEAYHLAPRGSVTYALAYSYRQQYAIDGDPAKLKRAVELFQEYVDKGETEKRDRAIGYLGELRPTLERIEAQGPVASVQVVAKTGLLVSSNIEGATGSVDGGAAHETPFVAKVAVGKHQVRVTAAGFTPADKQALAVEGQIIPAEVRLVEVPATLAIRAPRGAEIEVDGRMIAIAPLRSPLTIGSGRHDVAVVARGRVPWSTRVTLARGESRTLVATLPSTSQRRASYWVEGGGGLLLASAIVTTTLAFVAQSDAQAIDATRAQSHPLTVAQRDAYNADVSDRDSYRAASIVLYGASAAVLGTAVLLYWFDTPRAPARDDATTIVPAVGPGELGVSVSRRF